MDERTEQSDSSGDNTALPNSVLVCFSLLGFTTGMYVGWSETPVVGSFVTGMVTVLVGGAMTFVVGRKEAPVLSREKLSGLANCVVLLCLFAIVGTATGIELRTGFFTGWNKPEGQKESALLDLTTYAGTLRPEQLFKLTLIQQALSRSGVPVERNNTVMKQLGDSLKQGKELLATREGPQLNHVRRYLRESRALLRDIQADHYRLQEAVNEYNSKHSTTIQLLDKDVLNTILSDGLEAELALLDLKEPVLDVILDVLLQQSKVSHIVPEEAERRLKAQAFAPTF